MAVQEWESLARGFAALGMDVMMIRPKPEPMDVQRYDERFMQRVRVYWGDE